jgi:hypothetical protein
MGHVTGQGDGLMLEDALHWIEPITPLLDATAAALAILGVLFAVAKAIGPGIRPLLLRSINACAAALKRFDIRPEISCAELRLCVLLAGTDSLLDILARSYTGVDDAKSSIAAALAFIGKSKEATAVSRTGAAWGIAYRSGPRAALHFFEYDSIGSKRDSIEDEFACRKGLTHLVDSLDTEVKVREWQTRKLRTVPYSNIISLLARESPLLKLPSIFHDASDYLKSELVMVAEGWPRILDVDLLLPIDEKRLRVLRRIVARYASCKSMPKMSANLALLAYAQTFQGAPEEASQRHTERE